MARARQVGSRLGRKLKTPMQSERCARFLWLLRQVTDRWGLNYTRSCDRSGGRKPSGSGSHRLRARCQGPVRPGGSREKSGPCLSQRLGHPRCLACGPSSIFKASRAAAPWAFFHGSVGFLFPSAPCTREDPRECRGPHGKRWKLFPSSVCRLHPLCLCLLLGGCCVG